MTNAETVAANIVQREGMPAPQDIGDGAGVTQIGGQTLGWLSQWSLPIPKTEFDAISNIMIWLAKSGQMPIVALSLPLGDVIADWCYTSGLRTGIQGLQGVLGVATDGLIGPKTLDKLRAEPDPSALVRDVSIRRCKLLAAAFAHGQIKPEFCVGEFDRALSFI